MPFCDLFRQFASLIREIIGYLEDDAEINMHIVLRNFLPQEKKQHRTIKKYIYAQCSRRLLYPRPSESIRAFHWDRTFSDAITIEISAHLSRISCFKSSSQKGWRLPAFTIIENDRKCFLLHAY